MVNNNGLNDFDSLNIEFKKELNFSGIFDRAVQTQSSDLLTLNRHKPQLYKIFLNSKLTHTEQTHVEHTKEQENKNNINIDLFERRSRFRGASRKNKSNDAKKERNFGLSKAFKSPSPSPFPWISSIHSSIINSNLSTKLTDMVGRFRSSNIEDTNEAALQKYTTPTPLIGRRAARIITRALPKTLELLGHYKEFTPKKPVSITEAVDSLAKNTNSGFPLFKRKNSDEVRKKTKISVRNIFQRKGKTYKNINTFTNELQKVTTNPRLFHKFFSSNIKSFESLIYNSLFSIPTTVLNRLQISHTDGKLDDEIKIRPVWCIPYQVVVLEYMFFNHIIEQTQTFNSVSLNPTYATSLSAKEISQKIVRRLFIAYKRGVVSSAYLNKIKKLIYSLDFSKYDQSLNLFFIDLFCAWVEQTLSLSIREVKIFSLLRQYLKFTPIVHKNEIHIKQRGIASGNYITNYFGSFVNILITVSVHFIWNDPKSIGSIRAYIKVQFSIFGKDFKGSHCVDVGLLKDPIFSVCGDDLVILCEHDFLLLHRRFCEDLGMSVGIKHTFDGFSDLHSVETLDANAYKHMIFFLGRYWNKEFKPWHTEEYMINHILLRTKFYKEWVGNITSEEGLELSRLLSITLAFQNGKSFLEKHYSKWNVYTDFVSQEKDFTLLKEWPQSSISNVIGNASFDYLFEGELV